MSACADRFVPHRTSLHTPDGSVELKPRRRFRGFPQRFSEQRRQVNTAHAWHSTFFVTILNAALSINPVSAHHIVLVILRCPMQKLRMDLAELHVETFAVTPSPDDDRGTVLARADTYSACVDEDTFLQTYGCWQTSLQTREGCSAYCDSPPPPWTQWCPEEDPTV
jgi:hypothetical protein